MAPSVTTFRLAACLIFLVFAFAAHDKRSIALGRLSLRPGKRSSYSARPRSLQEITKIVRLPTVVAQCSNAHMEAVAGSLENLVRLLDKYSVYLETCRDLGYSS